MFEPIEKLPPDIFGIEVSGKLSEEDCNTLNMRMAEYRESHTTLRILMEVEASEWGDIESFWKEIELDMEHFKNVKKAAAVVKNGWKEKTVTVLKGILPGMEIETFDPDDREAAIKWLERR